MNLQQNHTQRSNLKLTSAPSSVKVSIRTAVWIVMWRQPAILAPFRGFLGPYRFLISIKPGISFSARIISLRPQSARLMSADKNKDKLLCAVSKNNPYPAWPHGRYWKLQSCGIGRGSNQNPSTPYEVWIFSKTTISHYSVDLVRSPHILYSKPLISPNFTTIVKFNLPTEENQCQHDAPLIPSPSSLPIPTAISQYYSLPCQKKKKKH